MEPSFLKAQIEKWQSELNSEADPATKREMKRTLKHLYAQYRKATKHRQPWYGLKVHLLFLAALLACMVYLFIRLEQTFGWLYTVSAFTAGSVGLVIITAMIFLVMKVISPDNYQTLLQLCFDVLHNLRGNGKLDRVQAAAKPKLPLPTLSTDSPKVKFREPTAQLADKSSKDDSIESNK